LLNWQSFYRLFRHNSKGFSIIEVLVALALLGIIAVAFLGGLATASKAMIIADERATAESLARSEMEYVKNCEYEFTGAPTYEKDNEPSSTHSGYFICVDALLINPYSGKPLLDPADWSYLITAGPYDPLYDEQGGDPLTHPDTGEQLTISDVQDIQKIIVNIYHHPDTDPDPVITLEDYKVDR